MEMIGFIGLGTIGGTIAMNLRQAGYPMMVYDIRPEAMQLLVTQGAQSAASPAEVARHCRRSFYFSARSAGSRASRSWTIGAFTRHSRRQPLRGSVQQRSESYSTH